MSSDCIVISSDNESEFQSEDEIQIVDREPESVCKEGVFYISSSEDDQALFVPKMKSDPEELPKICFETREARRHRHRHKYRKRSNENEHREDGEEEGEGKLLGNTNTDHPFNRPNDDLPVSRIPPLPDLSLFCPDALPEDGNSQSVPETPKSKAKKPVSAKKKRQSIEAIKSKEREILGDLFAVDRESSDSDCIVTGTRNKFGDFVKNIRERHAKDTKRRLQLKSNNQTDKKVGNTTNGPLKNTANRNQNAKGKSLESEKPQNIKEGSRSRNSSGKSQDGKNNSKEKVNKNVLTNTATDTGQSHFVKKISRCLSEQNHESTNEKELVSGLNKKAHFLSLDRNVTDKSDTCHQIGSRVGPFDLLASLGRSYKKELENLKISPRSRSAVKEGLIPVVNIGPSRSLSLFRSKSVESSESESETEKSKRHFLDVFSDISEAETDDTVEKTDNISEGLSEFDDTTLTLSESFYNKINESFKNDDTLTFQSYGDIENEGDKENDEQILKQDIDQRIIVLPGEIKERKKDTSSLSSFDGCSAASFKNLNYQVKSEEFSDISEDDESQKVLTGKDIISDIDEVDAVANSPVGGTDYLGNSTLTSAESDESVIHVTGDNVEEMPQLEKVTADKCKVTTPTFEMPILEKYGEMYSSFRNELEDQEMLPDISDDENEIKVNDMPLAVRSETREISPELIVEKSSQRSEIPNPCNNIFMKFSLTPAKSSVTSSSVTASSETVSSVASVPLAVSKLTSTTVSFKSSKSDIVLSSPKGCSTPKSRKRKIIRKSNTCSSFCSLETYSSSLPSATSSQLEQLSLTKQMDQLTIYMNDFIRLNDSGTVFPKIPEAQKNIVYGCEEDGILNLGHALNFVEHFCRKYIIPSDLCNDIIKAAFYSECKLSHIHWAYSLLSELNTRRGAEIEINWDMIDHCLKVALSAGKGKPYCQLLQSTLLLQLGVDVLKVDLYTRELSDNRQIRKTYAYKMFAYDVTTGNRKSLIYFLNQALHAGQCRTGTNGETFQLPDVLPMLQDLFALCVDVSSNCVDCANTLAADMVTTYKFLPNLADKQLLIKSISSNLLQCKLVQQVLESQYDCNLMLGRDFPDSLEDMIQCFFKVMPLKNPLTPPTTPNEDMLWEEEGHFHRFAADVTEEIVILLYFVVVSYLQSSNDKLYMALRRRVNLPDRKKKLRTEDVQELGRMKEHVQELEEHLRGMTPDLTENTEHYLFMMSCLGDLGQIQQE